MATRPTAELHVHLEGTIAPARARALAARNGIALPPDVAAAGERYRWSDFRDFLRVYEAVAGVLTSAGDYAEVTDEYLRGVAATGAVYVELTVSPAHATRLGIAWREHLDGVANGIRLAREACGIEARILMIGLRHRAPEEALEAARWAVACGEPLVTGFGLAGDERAAPLADFAPAFAVAVDGGLGANVHAGELLGPASVRDALALPVTRIAHGVRAVEDTALVAELAARGIVLEVCPSSNVALGVCASYAEHPLRVLWDAGVRVTLGSDDPPHFATTLAGEYAVARDAFGFDEAELREVTRTALRAAFVDEPTRARLLAQVG